MARPRVIDQNDILDAAEAVVRAGGASKLTLDAVAAEAGISKASVIYDYKSKQELIRAVVRRRIDEDRNRLRELIESMGDAPDACIRGHIERASEAMPDDVQTVAISLISSLARDSEMSTQMQGLFREELDNILSRSNNPRSALLAFLALEGLRLLEFLGCHTWPANERAAILADISQLLDMPLCTPDRAQ